LSADGKYLFASVATDNMAVFFNNAATNQWQFVQVVRNNNGDVSGLFAPSAVVVGDDGAGNSRAYVTALGHPAQSNLGGVVSFAISSAQPQPISVSTQFTAMSELSVNTRGNADTITFASAGSTPEWVKTTINIGVGNAGAQGNVVVLQ